MNNYVEKPTQEDFDAIISAAELKVGRGVFIISDKTYDENYRSIQGTIEIDEISHYFHIVVKKDSTEVIAWGDIPKRRRKIINFTFIPTNTELHKASPELFKVYVYWRKSKWFKELEKNYNADKIILSSEYVDKYYTKQIESKGLKIGLLSDLPKEALDILEEKKKNIGTV